METINTINFQEELSQEDTSFHCAENNSEHMEETTQEEDTRDEPISENNSESEEECLDMDQVPLGSKKIVCGRNGETIEGEELVFVNPDTDLPVQTLEELDSKDLDDDNDVSFNPENVAESPSQEEDEACEDSDRESVDGEDLNGCMMKLGVHEHSKLIWAKKEVDTNEEEAEEEEEMASEDVDENVEAKYNEDEDPDFNPVYCGETLSDCDEDVEGEEEPVPQVLNLDGDTCTMKCEEVMMIPTDTGIPVGPPAVDAEAPMECE
jgi:hypothetical protein